MRNHDRRLDQCLKRSARYVRLKFSPYGVTRGDAGTNINCLYAESYAKSGRGLWGAGAPVLNHGYAIGKHQGFDLVVGEVDHRSTPRSPLAPPGASFFAERSPAIPLPSFCAHPDLWGNEVKPE